MNSGETRPGGIFAMKFDKLIFPYISIQYRYNTIQVGKWVIFYASLYTVKDPYPYKYQVRMWASNNTIY